MSSAIKIGFDAKRVFQNFTGLGNFSRTLLGDLSKNSKEFEWHLFAPKEVNNPRTQDFLQEPFKNHFAKTMYRTAWRSKGIVKDLQKANINIYHGLSHEIPMGIESSGIRTILSMHDLIIKADPNQFNWLDRKIYNSKFKSSCSRADQIVAISESTKNDIIKYYDIPAEKIKVIYQTCHEQFRQKVSDESVDQFLSVNNLPKEYLLYVGSAIPRKNLLGLAKAYARLPEDLQIPILVVAGNSNYRKKVEQYVAKKKLSKHFYFLNKFPFEELPKLYKGATALAYPSQYEGFGLPLIEALFQHTPVLTGNNSSLTEAAGPGARYVDSHSIESIHEGLEQILNDESLRKELAQAGNQHVQQFQSKPIIQEWISTYKSIV